MAIIENTEENSLKLEKLSTQKSKELQEILAAKSPMENYQNVAEYLNENIVNEKAKTLNFLQINISSKTTHSENQNGNYKNSATNISGHFCDHAKFIILFYLKIQEIYIEMKMILKKEKNHQLVLSNFPKDPQWVMEQ